MEQSNKVIDNKSIQLIFAIYKYEKFIDFIYTNIKKDMTYKGYIIKLEDYQNLKKKVNYNDFYNDKEKNLNYNKINELMNPKETQIDDKIETIIFKSPQDLINLIKKKNEYLIINEDLFNIICNQKKNIQYYSYIIDKNNLVLVFDNGEAVQFYHSNNILDEISYLICKDNKLVELSNKIMVYYDYENQIKKKLEINGSSNNIQENEYEIGYLINKNWIDQWKEYTNYNNIKRNLFDKENIDMNKNNTLNYKIIKEMLKNHKIDIKKQKTIELLKFQTINDFELYFKNNSLAIINGCFYYLINNNNIDEEYKINFIPLDKTIKIFINKTSLEFYANNNVILSDKENNLKILIKIFYFQEQMNKNIKLSYLQKLTHIGMIQKEWIEQFKRNYDYNILYFFF